MKKFFIGFALPLLVIALLCGGSSVFLLKSGEYLPLDDIIAWQEETTGLYGSALHQRAFYYKQHLYAHVKPALAALGSSRVLQFRASDFSKPFVNLGSMSDLDEVTELAKSVFTEHKPRVVILGIDTWWFHPDAEKNFVNRSPEDVSPTAGELFDPFRWLIEGKMSPGDVARTLKGATPHIGIAAIMRGDGYSVDGSYHYTSTLTGAAPPDDPKFGDSLGKIEAGSKIYAHGDKISQVQWKKLQILLDFLQEKKIAVVMFLPPFAPAVTQAMTANGGYGYVTDLRWMLAKMAKERGLPFFDFHEATSLGATDCEFVDGHHGGPVVYQRILLNMAIGDDAVRGMAKLPEIGWNIQNYTGRASLLPNETDFLQIGCEKK